MSFQSSFYLFGMEKGLNNMFEIEVRYLMHVHRFSYIVYILERLLESSQGYGKVMEKLTYFTMWHAHSQSILK